MSNECSSGASFSPVLEGFAVFKIFHRAQANWMQNGKNVLQVVKDMNKGK